MNPSKNDLLTAVDALEGLLQYAAVPLVAEIQRALQLLIAAGAEYVKERIEAMPDGN
jgi:hypothetical protein